MLYLKCYQVHVLGRLMATTKKIHMPGGRQDLSNPREMMSMLVAVIINIRETVGLRVITDQIPREADTPDWMNSLDMWFEE